MNSQHTIQHQENDEEGIEIGSLTVVGRISNDRRTITVWGWRNDNEELNDPFGDCEVEIAKFDFQDESDEYVDLVFTLTQEQVDDALSQFDLIYLTPVIEYGYDNDSIDTDAIAERAFALGKDRGYLTAGNVLLTDVDEIEAYLIKVEREKIRARHNS